MKKNDLYMISGTEYKEMTKEILAQSDLWAEIKKKADQKQKNADQMLIGIKPNLVSPTEASYGATTHPEIVAGIIEYLQERSCQHIVMLESSWVGDKTWNPWKSVDMTGWLKNTTYHFGICSSMKAVKWIVPE